MERKNLHLALCLVPLMVVNLHDQRGPDRPQHLHGDPRSGHGAPRCGAGEPLLRVELPLAGRTIMAGVRTSEVISIGVATLLALIGAGGLRDPIVTGLQLNDAGLILSDAVPAALLAFLAASLFGDAERGLTAQGLA